jgi:triacylglycerol lipase
MSQFRRARSRTVFGSLVAAAAALGGSLAVAAPAHADQAPRDPVLFVHGFTRSSADFDTFKANFLANGYSADQLFTIDYALFDTNEQVAAQISTEVDQILAQTGKKYVDIVAHSMGAFGTRYYLRNLGGQPKVDAFVSIAGPNHGTYAATNESCVYPVPGTPIVLPIQSCRDMVPGSPFLTNPLTGVNTGDETPNLAKTRYFTMRTKGDDLVFPSSSTELAGATNWVHLNENLTHMQIAVDTDTINQTRTFIANS